MNGILTVEQNLDCQLGEQTKRIGGDLNVH